MSDLAKYQLNRIDIFKNWASLSAAIIGVAGLKFPVLLMPATYYINSYVFVDLFFAKRDMVVHHLLVLSFFAVITLYDFPAEYKREFMNSVIRFEYSTLFYGGGPLVLHYLSSRQVAYKWVPKVKTVLNLAFALTFFKFRIYDFAVDVVFRKYTYSPEHFSNRVAFVHLVSTTWGFYALNLYWLQIIIWKMTNIGFTEKGSKSEIFRSYTPPKELVKCRDRR